MLTPREDEAMPPFPATHLLRRLRHALDRSLAGLCVDGVPGRTQWRILQAAKLRGAEASREDGLGNLLLVPCNQLQAGGCCHIERLRYGVVSNAC